MVFDYLTYCRGMSSDPQIKRTPKAYSFARLLSGEQVILSRAQCSFHSRARPKHLNGERLKKAIEISARAVSPYTNPGFFIKIGQERVAVWTYDLDEIANIKSISIRKIIPESALHAPSEGLAICRVLEGYEAQYWVDNELVTSRWWATSVSESEWEKFCLAAERFGASKVPMPPVSYPERLPNIPINALSFQSRIEQISLSDWGWLTALIVSVFATYFGLRLLILDVRHAHAKIEYETLWKEKSDQRQASLRLAQLSQHAASLADLYRVPHPLPPLSVTLSQALEENARIETIYYDGTIFEVTFTTDEQFSQRDFVAKLESSYEITDVNLIKGQRVDLWELSFAHANVGGE